jgi:hypothetical protein
VPTGERTEVPDEGVEVVGGCQEDQAARLPEPPRGVPRPARQLVEGYVEAGQAYGDAVSVAGQVREGERG